MGTLYEAKRDEIRKAVWHVLYEMETFIMGAQDAIDKHNEPRFALESRLLHTRNIIDFFSDERFKIRGVEQDDIVAKDFGFLPIKVTLEEPYWTRLNKYLSHLTYTRTSDGEPGTVIWPFMATVVPLLGPCRAFAQHLLSNVLASSEQPNRDKAESLIKAIDVLQKIDFKVYFMAISAISTQGSGG